MNKKQLVFVAVAAVIVAGVLLGGDFFSGMAHLADPKPGF